jgi:serine/threonine-protein kinase RsbW
MASTDKIDHGSSTLQQRFELAAGGSLADAMALVAELRRRLDESDAAAAVNSRVEIGVAEALANIAKHGYAGSNPGSIHLSCYGYADRVVVEIVDRGAPIPAGRLESATMGCANDWAPQAVASIAESGRGLALLKACFERVEYSSHSGQNRLTLVALRAADIHAD